MASSASAITPVVFDFSTPEAWTAGNDKSSFTMTSGDLTITLGTTSNWLSHTGAFLLGGSGPLDTNGLLIVDDDNDAFTIRFNKDVTLASYVPNFLNWKGAAPNNNESISLSDGTTTKTQSFSSQTWGQSHNFTDPFVLSANTDLTITCQNPGSEDLIVWSSLTVNAVPEPAVYALLLGTVAFGLGYYRRRQKRRSS